jgi:hypothetical protein
MRSNKIGALFIISAMALAGVGTSFAMWTATINSVETVNVATFGIGWSTGPVNVEGDTQGIIWGEESIDGYGNLVVTIHNAYPCCDIYINYDVHLTGQVWAILNEITFSIPREFKPNWIVDYSHTDGVLVDGTAYNGWIHVHLDNDAVPGATYTFTNQLTCHQYNECNPPSGPKTLNLPTDVIHAVFYHYGPVSYWETDLSGVPNGYDVNNGAYVGWCVDNHHGLIYPGLDYTIQLFSSYDAGFFLNHPGWSGNFQYSWPCVNWIINHKDSYSIDQIQDAIWYYVDGGVDPGGPAHNLIIDAFNNGQNYVPQTGDVMAVLCFPNPNNQHGLDVQHTFIEVDP